MYMGLTMSQRKALSAQTAARYRRSTKKEKEKDLEEFVGRSSPWRDEKKDHRMSDDPFFKPEMGLPSGRRLPVGSFRARLGR